MWAKAGRLVGAVLLGTVVARAPEVRAQTAGTAAADADAIRRTPMPSGARRGSLRRGGAACTAISFARRPRLSPRCTRSSASPTTRRESLPRRCRCCKRALDAQARSSESRRAARDVTVGAGTSTPRLCRVSSARLRAAGIRRWCAPSDFTCSASIHGPRARCGRGGCGTRTEPPVSRRPGGAVPHRATLLELRVPADHEARSASRRTRSGCIRPREKPTRARDSGTPPSGNTEQVLAAAPNRPGLHFRIGRVLLAQAGQAGSDASSLTSRARQQFELELQRDPTNANAAYELGEMQRRAGELEQAVASFGAAVHSDPGFLRCARRSRTHLDRH